MLARIVAVSLVLGAHGIGPVRFGTPKPQAVAALSRILGQPTSRAVNPGCGARYTEVDWGDLEAEFRLGSFSGTAISTAGSCRRWRRRRASPSAAASPS